jgi:heme peroxidase
MMSAMSKERRHGDIRGFDEVIRSRIFQGRFGRMFRNLPPAEFVEDDLLDLGQKMMPDLPVVPEGQRDPSESMIPAGYTYLGQFIAHDLTFDPVSSLQHDNDPDALVDYRTPRFDLDCLYGRGPVDQPYLYDPEKRSFVLGKLLFVDKRTPDVPRNVHHCAIIADPRNDENVIISQMHMLFVRFHNLLARKTDADFASIQQAVRWHYQWLVLHDFLERIVDKTTYNEVLPHLKKRSDVVRNPPELRFYKPRSGAFLPIEFSAAAYRFGHSMVRRQYRLNTRSPHADASGPLPIMGEKDGTADLRGFRLPRVDWFIEWELFFDNISQNSRLGSLNKDRVQPAFKIDTMLTNPLSRLPRVEAGAKATRLLAQRNLLRGWRLGLPSGQAVAHAMGETPLSENLLTVGLGENAKRLMDISPRFKGNAPLWFYILAEAQQRKFGGNKLGPVGGRIVMETFVGLMMEDGHSYLRQDPLWSPLVRRRGRFGMSELIKLVTHQRS